MSMAAGPETRPREHRTGENGIATKGHKEHKGEAETKSGVPSGLLCELRVLLWQFLQRRTGEKQIATKDHKEHEGEKEKNSGVPSGVLRELCVLLWQFLRRR